MKKVTKILISLFLILSFCAILPAAAEETDLYYVNVPILKIFPHKLGYYVIYRRSNLKTGEAYIPLKWFDHKDLRAVLNRTTDDITPYFSYLTKNGEFDHIRLNLPKNIQHPVWGVLQSGAKFDKKFDSDTFKLEY